MIYYKLKVGEDEKEVLADLSLSNEKNVSRMKKNRILCALMFFVSLIWGCKEIFMGRTAYVKTLGVILLIMAVYFAVIFFAGKKIQKRRTLSEQKRQDSNMIPSEMDYEFSDEGVKFMSEKGNGINYWNAFTEYGTHGNYIYLKRIDGHFVLVKQDDLSPSELSELKKLLNNISFAKPGKEKSRA